MEYLLIAGGVLIVIGISCWVYAFMVVRRDIQVLDEQIKKMKVE